MRLPRSQSAHGRRVVWVCTLASITSLLFVLHSSGIFHRQYTAPWRRKLTTSRPPILTGFERIALVTLYAGASLPWFSNYFAESCGAQRPGIVDCYIVQVSDDPGTATTLEEVPPSKAAARLSCRRPDDKLPRNVHILITSFSGFRSLVRERTGLHLEPTLPNPRKLADFKPLLGELLEQQLRPYTAWGWVDLDMVLGDVAAFANSAATLVKSASSSGSAGPEPQVALPDGSSLTGWPNEYPTSLPWDVWSSSFEGQPSWPPLSGQFTLLRNTRAHAELWRHVPTEASPATQGASRARGPGMTRVVKFAFRHFRPPSQACSHFGREEHTYKQNSSLTSSAASTNSALARPHVRCLTRQSFLLLLPTMPHPRGTCESFERWTGFPTTSRYVSKVLAVEPV